jgi:hypothetical protein
MTDTVLESSISLKNHIHLTHFLPSSSPPTEEKIKQKTITTVEEQELLEHNEIQKAERLFSLSTANQLPRLGVSTTAKKVYFRF